MRPNSGIKFVYYGDYSTLSIIKETHERYADMLFFGNEKVFSNTSVFKL